MDKPKPEANVESNDQSEVLAKKGNVTQGKLGLQQWGDEGQPDAKTGTAGLGTAARQAKASKGQAREK